MFFIQDDEAQSLCVSLSRLRISTMTAARLGVDTKEKVYKYCE